MLAVAVIYFGCMLILLIFSFSIPTSHHCWLAHRLLNCYLLLHSTAGTFISTMRASVPPPCKSALAHSPANCLSSLGNSFRVRTLLSMSSRRWFRTIMRSLSQYILTAGFRWVTGKWVQVNRGFEVAIVCLWGGAGYLCVMSQKWCSFMSLTFLYLI